MAVISRPKSCILLLIVSLLIVITYSDGANCASVTPNHSKHPILLVVSFDGFRFDYMTKTDMPTLRVLQNEGVSVPFMKAQFPTRTFPNHQSIATGVYPDIHGVTDNFLYDPLYNKNLSGYKDDPQFWNYHPDVLPFWIRNEQTGDGRYSGCYMWAGSSQGYGVNGTLFPTHYISTYNGSVPWEDRVDTSISWLTHDKKPANIIFLYHEEPDSRGHKSGTDDPELIEELKRVDKRVAYLVKRLKDVGMFDKINLVILGDHGMQTVYKENIINTTAFVDPQRYERISGSPFFQIKPKNNADSSEIYDAFKAASEGKHFSVFRKSELGHLKYGKNRRVMGILLLAEPGYAFDDTRLNSNGVHGAHGYDNNSPNMTTIFIARGPVFKKGFKSPVIENVDLFPMFSKIMGVPYAASNGSLKIVSQFLTASSCKVNVNLLGMLLSVVFAGFY